MSPGTLTTARYSHGTAGRKVALLFVFILTIILILAGSPSAAVEPSLAECPETTLSAEIGDPSALSLACCGPLRSEVVPASARSVTILVDRGAEEKA